MRSFIIFFFILSALATKAQTKVSGTVRGEDGTPIPGANVFIQDSYDGASTSLDGSFEFSTSELGERTLLATFVGYKSRARLVTLGGSTISIHIVLKEDINQLDAVVISAGSFTAGEENRRTILKALDIATTAGATADIAGALNTLPGTQKVAESGRLFVRGGDGNETKTFIDGMAVLDAYNPTPANTPSRGRFLPFMFKGTSFSTGGYAAEYGQALSSALVLNSKDKAELNQTDIGILSVGADVAHTQVWDKSSLSAKVQYTDIRPYFNLINQEIDWIKPPVSFEASSAFRQETGDSGSIKFFGNFSRSTYSLFNHDILDPQRKQAVELTNNYGYGNVSVLQALNPKWSIRGGFSYNLIENDVLLEEVPLAEREQGTHLKVVLENSLTDKVELKFGVEQLGQDYKASRLTDTQQFETLRFTTPITAVFTEGEALFSKKFVGKIGVRAEYNGLVDQVGVDPRISLAYKPFQNGQFAFAFGQFRQTPDNDYVRLNNNLLDEKSQHFILNYQVVNDRRTFRTEVYYKKYSRLVSFESGDPLASTSTGDGFAKGFELFWRDNKSIKNVDYWVSYSYLDTERNYLDFPTASTPTFASKHNFSFVYKHFVKEIKSQLGFTYSYTSGRPYNDPNLDQFNSQRTPFYQDLSMNISYLPKPFLIIHFSATNLLGRDNIFGYEYSALPDAGGVYQSRATRLPAKRFLFLGVFITISKNKSVNQLPNL
ncbi:MAG: TonB-dependent receptor [Cyclobacteriaceae bacterium]